MSATGRCCAGSCSSTCTTSPRSKTGTSAPTRSTATRIEGFWRDPRRRSFLLRVDGTLAGFAIIREGAHFAGEGTREISEFFVLRRYRRRGVGEEVARAIFDAFPGRWEVAQTARNVDAQAFWRRVLGRYTQNRCTEEARPDGQGVLQRFDNSAR